MRYENLLSDLKTELRKILNFLDFPQRKETLECVATNAEGHFHRNHSSFDPFIGMNPNLLELMGMVQQAIDKALNYGIDEHLIWLMKKMT